MVEGISRRSKSMTSRRLELLFKMRRLLRMRLPGKIYQIKATRLLASLTVLLEAPSPIWAPQE